MEDQPEITQQELENFTQGVKALSETAAKLNEKLGGVEQCDIANTKEGLVFLLNLLQNLLEPLIGCEGIQFIWMIVTYAVPTFIVILFLAVWRLMAVVKSRKEDDDDDDEGKKWLIRQLYNLIYVSHWYRRAIVTIQLRLDRFLNDKAYRNYQNGYSRSVFWSWQSYDRALLLAVMYPFSIVIIMWVVTNEGQVGDFTLLPKMPLWQRIMLLLSLKAVKQN